MNIDKALIGFEDGDLVSPSQIAKILSISLIEAYRELKNHDSASKYTNDSVPDLESLWVVDNSRP